MVAPWQPIPFPMYHLRVKLLTITLALCGLLQLPLAAAEGDGYIKARGKPTGAGLFVDGKYIGPAGRFTVPEKYAVPPGEHEISLKDPRYEDYTTKVTVVAGKTAKISYKLTPAEPAKPPFGLLRVKGGTPESFMSVTSGDLGAVYINDKFYGFVDELNNKVGGLLLPPGEYTVKIETENFGSVNEKVNIEANKTTYVELKK